MNNKFRMHYGVLSYKTTTNQFLNLRYSSPADISLIYDIDWIFVNRLSVMECLVLTSRTRSGTESAIPAREYSMRVPYGIHCATMQG